MTFIQINDTYSIECIQKGKKYLYQLKEGHDEPYSIGSNFKSPLEHSKSSDVGKQIYEIVKATDYPSTTNQDAKQIIRKEFQKILEALNNDLQNAEKQIQKEIKKQEEATEENYLDLAGHFEMLLDKHKCTPLQLITRISEGLAVDAHLQIMQAHMGYSQTYYAINKATNVIAIGGQSSGKTYCLDAALDMIPQENIHRGVMTEASLYKTYNGMNLNGNIYYMGDLGGDNDNEKTTPMRDVLKQLTTDGYSKRGLIDTNTNDPSGEELFGYPALSYTTANEDIIDPQERSRSVLIYPPDVNQKKLVMFNSFMESPGNDWRLKNQIEKDKQSVKGYVYKIKQEIGNFEVYNPYAFCIQEHLKDIEDFNRKIQEFDRALRIVCIYSNAKQLTHYIYKDKEYNSIETPLFIPSKQNNVDTLALFDSSIGLLPTDIKLAKGLITKYSIYSIDKDMLDAYGDISFEDKVHRELIKRNPDTVTVGEDVAPTKWNQISNYNSKEDKELPCFFTVDTIKEHSNSRWYRENNQNMSKKLSKLHEHRLLIKVGKSNDGRNIYGLNESIIDKIFRAVPTFDPKLVKLGKDEFHRRYSTKDNELIEEFDRFMAEDSKVTPKSNSFEITKNDHIYNLPWNNLGDIDE